MEASNLSRCLEQYEALTSADELIKDELLRNFKPGGDKSVRLGLKFSISHKRLSSKIVFVVFVSINLASSSPV